MYKITKIIGIGTQYANIQLGEQVLIHLDSLKYLKNQGRQVYKCIVNNNDVESIKLLINNETFIVEKNVKNIIIYNLITCYNSKEKCNLTFESNIYEVNSFISNKISEEHRKKLFDSGLVRYLQLPTLTNQQTMWKCKLNTW